MTTSLSRLQELLPQLFQAHQLPGEPYLRFQLTADITALLPMEQVKESLLVNAEQVTPLPNLPDSVMGIMSSRNQVFCVIDLAQMLMLQSVANFAQRYHVVVIRLSPGLFQFASDCDLLLGIAVERILGISRLTSDKIQLPTIDLPSSLRSYAWGAVVDGDKETLVLDILSIATDLSLYEKKK